MMEDARQSHGGVQYVLRTPYMELERRLRYRVPNTVSKLTRVFKVQAGEQTRSCPLFPNRKLVLPAASALQSFD